MVDQEIKSQLRNLYRKQRQDRFIPNSWLHLTEVDEIKTAKNITSYISYEFEPETSDLNQRLINDGKTLYLPRRMQNNDLQWVCWDGDRVNLKKVGKIFEPIGPEVDVKDIHVMIIPALQVDQNGNRLGQGGGSYDRALAKSNAWKIALVHKDEITSAQLPSYAHDVKVNAVATAEMVIRF